MGNAAHTVLLPSFFSDDNLTSELIYSNKKFILLIEAARLCWSVAAACDRWRRWSEWRRWRPRRAAGCCSQLDRGRQRPWRRGSDNVETDWRHRSYQPSAQSSLYDMYDECVIHSKEINARNSANSPAFSAVWPTTLRVFEHQTLLALATVANTL